MKKILIIRYGAIGDVVHTSNIFRSIKAAHPDYRVDYLTAPVPAQILKNNSLINNVFELKSKDYYTLLKFAQKFRKERYDLIINLQPSLRFRFLTMMSMPKDVVVYHKDGRLHAVENFFLTAKKVMPELENPADLKLEISKDIIEKVKKQLPDFSGRKLVIVNVCTSPTRHGRKWPFDYFKKLITSLIERYNCVVLLPGAKENIEEIKYFENMHPDVHIIAGKFSLVESAAVFSLCDVFISGDTGPLHIATAFEKPVCIGLYGAAPVCRTGPYGAKHFTVASNLSCAPCSLRNCTKKEFAKEEINPCMTSIMPDDVISLINDNKLL